MRGRRRLKQSQDSLDLLLDAICNAFGGILLIALLISVITQQTKKEEADHASDVQNQILEREIVRYSAEIAAANAYLRGHAGSASAEGEGPKPDERVAEARSAIADAIQKVETSVSRTSDGEKIARETRQSTAELAAAEVRKKALEDQKAALEGRWADLQTAIAERSQTLRLPKEQQSRNRALWFILAHNEVFPTTVLARGGVRDNREAFKGEWGASEDVLQPVPGKGLPAAEVASALGTLLRKMSSEGFYAAILLKEDSVPAFIALKDALVANGVSFGWEYHAGGIYAFTLEGGSRPPQL
jgi:hypothetical protein